ncbi:4Fe-4S binding protein [bacterium]|nr:4Fe-4S binding protein [candidate division CSSED10-310 bacterium]
MTLRRWRLVSQIVFFLGWAAAFTRLGPTTLQRTWDTIYFRLDPLLGLLTMAAARTIITGMLPGLVFIVLTLVFGRVFCGWFCPLGTLIDFIGWLATPRRGSVRRSNLASLRPIKYGILTALSIAALAGTQFFLFFDPLVILTRSTAVLLSPITRQHLIPDAPHRVFESVLAIAMFFLAVILPTLFFRRFWCRVLCPAGALFGLLSRRALFRLELDDCNACKKCMQVCRVGILEEEMVVHPGQTECIRCFDCLEACRGHKIVYRPSLKPVPPRPDLSRRAFLGALAAGALSAPLVGIDATGRGLFPPLIRPPHAHDEPAFLDLCLRCGACLEACPSNALQPLPLGSGLAGIWSPHLVPEIGACLVDCKRCGAVCPTGAIREVHSIGEKLSVKMGTAYFLPNKCMTARLESQCGKCLTVCPTGAITAAANRFGLFPAAIDYLRCSGCGLCVNTCAEISPAGSALLLTARGRNQPCRPVLSQDYAGWRYH